MVINLTIHNLWALVFHSKKKRMSGPYAIVIILNMCSCCEMLFASPHSLTTYLWLILLFEALYQVLFLKEVSLLSTQKELYNISWGSQRSLMAPSWDLKHCLVLYASIYISLLLHYDIHSWIDKSMPNSSLRCL